MTVKPPVGRERQMREATAAKGPDLETATGELPAVEAIEAILSAYIGTCRDPQDLVKFADLLRTYGRIAARWSRARQAAA